MTVKLTRKRYKIEMIVKLTLVNVCMNTFITIVSFLMYRELLSVTKKKIIIKRYKKKIITR